MSTPGDTVPVWPIASERNTADTSTIIEAIYEGSYLIDEQQVEQVDEALKLADSGQLDSTAVQEVLHTTPNKVFRNAVTTLVIEEAWPGYRESVSTIGGIATWYGLDFDDKGYSRLFVKGDVTDETSDPNTICDRLGASNQAALSHFLCSHTVGNWPISVDTTADATYKKFFDELNTLDMYSGSTFHTIPEHAGSRNLFLTSGTYALRHYLFSLPGIIDNQANERGIVLDRHQHRSSVERTLAFTVPRFFVPTTPLIAAVSRAISNKDGSVDPSKWASMGDADTLLVFPDPDLIADINQQVGTLTDLPVQTRCPAFLAKVTKEYGTDSDKTKLPLQLSKMVLGQLDTAYYPARFPA